MDKEQFEQLKKHEETLITIEHLCDQSDRTLLYGYTCERDTWHVYIENKDIIVYQYNDSTFKSWRRGVRRNQEYIPDKRLYPERCDFEFCKLLKQHGCELPFTTWTDNIRQQVYYGKI